MSVQLLLKSKAQSFVTLENASSRAFHIVRNDESMFWWSHRRFEPLLVHCPHIKAILANLKVLKTWSTKVISCCHSKSNEPGKSQQESAIDFPSPQSLPSLDLQSAVPTAPRNRSRFSRFVFNKLMITHRFCSRSICVPSSSTFYHIMLYLPLLALLFTTALAQVGPQALQLPTCIVSHPHRLHHIVVTQDSLTNNTENM